MPNDDMIIMGLVLVGLVYFFRSSPGGSVSIDAVSNVVRESPSTPATGGSCTTCGAAGAAAPVAAGPVTAVGRSCIFGNCAYQDQLDIYTREIEASNRAGNWDRSFAIGGVRDAWIRSIGG